MADRITRNAHVGKIVERRMRNWELSARRESGVGVEPEAPKLHYTVMISREMGCCGEVVADMVARRLGWDKFDREILDYMASRTRVRRKLFDAIDEYHSNWMDDILKLFMPEGVGERSDYFYTLTRTILAICHHQPAVIVGRCANFILPRDHGLRVRLVAPLDRRVAVISAQQHLDDQQARRRIEQVDGQRARFAASHFGRFPYDPRHYDMVLNTATFTNDQLAEMIVRAMHDTPGGQHLGA